MACIVNLTLSVKPDLRAECLHELSLILPGTKSYSGCHWVYLSENSTPLTALSKSGMDLKKNQTFPFEPPSEINLFVAGFLVILRMLFPAPGCYFQCM